MESPRQTDTEVRNYRGFRDFRSCVLADKSLVLMLEREGSFATEEEEAIEFTEKVEVPKSEVDRRLREVTGRITDILASPEHYRPNADTKEITYLRGQQAAIEGILEQLEEAHQPVRQG